MKTFTIAYYFNDWRGGGSEKTIVDINTYLRNAGHQCSVGIPSTAHADLLEQAEIGYVNIGDVRSLNPIRFLRCVRRIAALVKDREIDVIQVFTFRLLPHAFIAANMAAFKKKASAQKKNISIVLVILMNWKRIFHYVAPLLCVIPTKIITFSQFWSHKLQQIPYLRTKVIYIPNSIDMDRFADTVKNRAAREQSKDAASEQIVGTVSRLIPTKNVAHLLYAAEMVLKKHKANFWIVGQGWEEEKNLKALAKQLGIEKQVAFLGQRDDIPRVLEKFDIFVTLSSGEGLPTATLEAMASGLPVIASDCPGNSEVVVNNVSGLLVPLGNIDEIARAIEALLSDRTKAYTMGCAGRARIEECYNAKDAMKKFNSVLESSLQ